MTCKEAIVERRSIRNYLDKPIPDAVMDSIIEAAMYAPSGVNTQPWHFVVLRSEEAHERLRTTMDTYAEKFLPTLHERFPNHPGVIAETMQFLKTLGGAPSSVLVFQYKKDYPQSASTVTQGISAAIQNLLLAAWEEGVGSCWLTAPLEMGIGADLQAEFAPEMGHLVAVITLGYPANTPKAPPRKENRWSIL